MQVCISRSTRLNIGAQGGNQSKLDRGGWETGKVEFILARLEVHLVLCCSVVLCCVVLCCVVLCCVVLCCVVVAQRAL